LFSFSERKVAAFTSFVFFAGDLLTFYCSHLIGYSKIHIMMVIACMFGSYEITGSCIENQAKSIESSFSKEEEHCSKVPLSKEFQGFILSLLCMHCSSGKAVIHHS
jgi:hypothetical protein